VEEGTGELGEEAVVVITASSALPEELTLLPSLTPPLLTRVRLSQGCTPTATTASTSSS
jgi:hypothetical protein